MLLRKDLSDFVRTDYDRGYYDGYVQALQCVMRDKKKYDEWMNG
jgi:hypothetical protein